MPEPQTDTETSHTETSHTETKHTDTSHRDAPTSSADDVAAAADAGGPSTTSTAGAAPAQAAAEPVGSAASSSADEFESATPAEPTEATGRTHPDTAAVADAADSANGPSEDEAVDGKLATDEHAGTGTDTDDAPVSGEALLVQEGEIAGDYLEQLLDILDYDGDIDLDVEGSRAIVAIVGANDLDPLVGTRGVTLDALQELTRLAVAQQTGVRTRLMLDVGGYRAGRRTELSALAATSVTRVVDSGEMIRMTPMNAFERKIVHDVVTSTDGVRSESEGEEPDRRVVILPDR